MAGMTAREMISKGDILVEYGSKYFTRFSLTPIGIDRVKISIVPINNGGKNDIVFYMQIDKFDLLADDVISGVFARKLEAETSQYPTAYQYVTGEDGFLCLNIGKAKIKTPTGGSCFILQLRNKKENRQYMMAVSMDAIKTAAKLFCIVTGRTPVAAGSYYGEFPKLFKKGLEEAQKFHKNEPDAASLKSYDETIEDLDDILNDGSKQEKPAPAPVTAPVKEQEQPKDTKQTFHCIVKGEKVAQKNYWVFSSDAGKVLFDQKQTAGYRWFGTMEEKAKTSDGVELKFVGEKRGDFILFVSVAK